MGNGTEDAGTAEGLPKDAADDDWVVECSDDETYNPCGLPGSVWEPRPEEAKALYERLSAGEVLTLEWVCRGRRSPPPEKEENEDEVKEEPEEQKQEERTLPSGFDFDEDMDPGMKPGFTPRRTPGSGQAPRSQKKRVARMDKIMNDILRHKKIEAAERKATPGRRLQGSPGGGQRKLGSLGGQRRLLSTLSDRKPPGTASAPAQAPGTGDKSFDFDDFGMGSEAPPEYKPPAEVSAGPVGQGAPPVQAPVMPPTDQKPVVPAMKEPTPPPPPPPLPVTGGTVEAVNIGLPPAPPPPPIPAPILPPAPTPESSSGGVSKPSEVLTSQMGTLTCKTEDEIKKEPEPLPETPITVEPVAAAAPPVVATNLPPLTTPVVDPSPVEVKLEPVEFTAPQPAPPPPAVQAAPAPSPSPTLSTPTAPTTEPPPGGHEGSTPQADSEPPAPTAAGDSTAPTPSQVEKMEVDATPADNDASKSETPATTEIKTET